VLHLFHFQDLLQTHRSAYNRLGKVQSSGNVLTHKQGNYSINSFNFFEKKLKILFLVQNLLKQSHIVPTTPEIENDLQSIAVALFDNLKDKNVIITHQRKTNK